MGWNIFKVHPEYYNLLFQAWRGKTKTMTDDLNISPSLEGGEFDPLHSLATGNKTKPSTRDVKFKLQLHYFTTTMVIATII